MAEQNRTGAIYNRRVEAEAAIKAEQAVIERQGAKFMLQEYLPELIT